VTSAKRAMDLVLGGALLLASLPVQLVVACVIRIRMGAPVLFRQERTGRYGHPFVLMKFRSMRLPDPAAGNPDDAGRLTALGRFLRSTSLDELPSLWNVLRGEMSLVGPRPLPASYLERYSAGQARRHEAVPGLTGWAQVNGRNRVTWDERFAADVWYVDHASLALDVRILLLTVKRVLARTGVSADGHATMPEFVGTRAGGALSGRADSVHRPPAGPVLRRRWSGPAGPE
jgi:lipopolysaccharide/colanic/teichoic acid biosynthesis glycosyltransferase